MPLEEGNQGRVRKGRAEPALPESLMQRGLPWRAIEGCTKAQVPALALLREVGWGLGGSSPLLRPWVELHLCNIPL